MNKLSVIPFRKDLLENFVYDGVESDISGHDIKDIAEYYSTLGLSFIGHIDGKVIGVGGVFPLWKSWGSCWLFVNKEAKNHKVCVFRSILTKMRELVRAYNIEILTVQCVDDSLEAHRLLDHLGFTKSKEFKMALYGRKI